MPAKKAKSTGAPVAKTSGPTPAYIRVKGGKYDITTTATGKIKATSSNGGTITFPKGTSMGAIATRLQEGDRMAKAAAKVAPKAKVSLPGKAKFTVSGRGGGAVGGMFGIKNR